MECILNIPELKSDLRENYSAIKKEFENALDKVNINDYNNGRTIGEWSGFGLKSVWGHWGIKASQLFPTVREILDSHSKNFVNVSLSRMGPETTINWHTGVQYKSALYKLAKKELESQDGSWIWDRDYIPEHKDIPLTRGRYEAYRFHYGISVPDEIDLLGLECEGKTHRWQNSETFMFKDWEMHRAWNSTKYPRWALIFDYEKSALSSAG